MGGEAVENAFAEYGGPGRSCNRVNDNDKKGRAWRRTIL